MLSTLTLCPWALSHHPKLTAALPDASRTDMSFTSDSTQLRQALHTPGSSACRSVGGSCWMHAEAKLLGATDTVAGSGV